MPLVAIHVACILATIAVVLYSDEQALLWILGKRALLDAKRLARLHAMVGVGLAAIIVSGGLLYLRAPSYYLGDPTFIVKMMFVAALIINGFFIGSLGKVSTERAWRNLSTRERLPLVISGAVSVVGWVGAAACGLLL